MTTTILLNGGLGRHITAIPALERYVTKNPDTIIASSYWTGIFWGNPLLSDLTFDINTKGLFERIRKTRIIAPEPYYNTDYLNERINLADAFNQELNSDKKSMPIPRLYLTSREISDAKAKIKTTEKKLIAFQPMGSTASIVNTEIVDPTVRSLNLKTCHKLLTALTGAGYEILLISDKELAVANFPGVIWPCGQDVRQLASSIACADYFIGCDSSGQHLARCFNIPGVVFYGGTSPVNVGYPNHFLSIEKNQTRSYMAYRLCDFDFRLAELQNADLLNFDDHELEVICHNILEHITTSITKESQNGTKKTKTNLNR